MLRLNCFTSMDFSSTVFYQKRPFTVSIRVLNVCNRLSKTNRCTMSLECSLQILCSRTHVPFVLSSKKCDFHTNKKLSKQIWHNLSMHAIVNLQFFFCSTLNMYDLQTCNELSRTTWCVASMHSLVHQQFICWWTPTVFLFSLKKDFIVWIGDKHACTCTCMTLTTAAVVFFLTVTTIGSVVERISCV